jgi:hypothetical protein
VAATFSLPAKSTKHSFPPTGGSLGSTEGICWDWGTRACCELGRYCSLQSHRSQGQGFPLLLPLLHACPSRFTLAEGDPCWVALDQTFPRPVTHSWAADIEREQGVTSAGGLVQGVSRAPSTA